METQIWIGVCTALAGVIGTLVLMGVHDIRRRISNLEKSDAKLTFAVLTSLMSKDPAAIAEAMRSLLLNGTGKADQG